MRNKSTIRKRQYGAYNKDANDFQPLNLSHHTFRFQNLIHESIGISKAGLKLSDNNHLELQTHFVPINENFVIGLDFFKMLSLQMESRTDMVQGRGNDCKLTLRYLHGHTYIKPH